ncbi:MAG: molybdopterin molybdotransferase MoeA [Kiritimatiellia bacterium]|jgi:molybdopterin molybdotransferase|nr:molybdopterin molybdotransferase MoeA [Kiritimatiellia bacterium]MDP6630439.1 molybdopterin molybdotransferase MoeA [Kiritimatiellia bacterium]MDP6809896.1 molybdopterin molybdotransferase MoeA [Kiritimatiellia bacterium]MDP7024288.1 molybdopterin molybdotransferase MoeA [Kiritimatiellia bacterium]
MITPLEAWERVVAHTAPLAAQPVALDSATGYILADPVVADRDVPPADRAAMDGYAVRADDLRECPAVLTMVGEVAAGSDATPSVGPGECVAIYTGANVPADTDTVIMVEDTEPVGEKQVRFMRAPRPGQHIFRQGENAQRGAVLLEAGALLGAAEVGVCAAVGVDRPTVYDRPRVSILSTGAELLDVSDAVGVHQLRNSNGPMLVSGLRGSGFDVVCCRAVEDDEEMILAAMQEMLADCDCLVLTGGVSVGKYDLVPKTIERLGGRIHFHGVAIKPGKPQLFATTDAGKILYGLPGNPLSSMVGLQEFILPALRRLSGWAPACCRTCFSVTLGKAIGGKTGRLRHKLAALTWPPDGPVAMPVEYSGSADLVAGAEADGTVTIPADVPRIEAGETVDFYPWRPVA